MVRFLKCIRKYDPNTPLRIRKCCNFKVTAFTGVCISWDEEEKEKHMLRRMMFMALLVGCVALLVTGANASEPRWPEKIKVGVIPTEGGADSKQRFQPLKDHLMEKLGITVEIVSASDYAGVITAMAHKHIDFAYFGPKSYVEAAEKADGQAIAMELDFNGNPGYTPIIIAKKGSGIQNMDEAKGKTFCFTDPNSTSGCLMPSVVFARDLKIKPESYFSKVSFSGSHGASMLAVKNGKVDVAATNDIDLGRMIEKGAVKKTDFTIIYSANPLPGAPMVARKDLPESLKAAFCGALMMINPKKDVIKKLGNGGYGPADDSDYDIIRYLKRVKAENAKKSG